jgi:hypothetical protein
MSETIAVSLGLPKHLYQALQRTARQLHKSEADLVSAALESYLVKPAADDPLLGLFADDPGLIDQVAQQAMQDRERIPLRLKEAARG